MNKNPVSILIGALLLVIFATLLFVFQVRQAEIAVVTRFGKPVRTLDKPGGPRWRLPWPIERVYKFDQRVQTYEDKLVQDPTSDSNNVLTQLYVGWRVTDAKVFFPRFANGSLIEAEKVLQERVRSAKSAVIGRHALSDFVSASQPVKLEEIEAEILKVVREQLQANDYGMDVEFLGFMKVGLPESVTPSVFERMKADRNVWSTNLVAQGDAEALKIKSAAEREAATKLARAEAEARRIRSEGEAAAAEMLPVFQQEPELAEFLLRLRALEETLTERTTLVFDQGNPPFDLLGGGLTNAAGRTR